jgi:hypothetical protein
VLLELNMSVAQIVLLPNTIVFGDAACSTSLEPKAATGCHLNGLLVVSADFIHHRRFDVLELSFRGRLVMDCRAVVC